MEITLKKRDLHNCVDIDTRRKAVNTLYEDINSLNRLQNGFDSLRPKEFLELFLKLYDIQLYDADVISLGKKVTGEKAVNIRNTRTEVYSFPCQDGVRRSISYRVRAVCPTSISLQNPISNLKLRSLMAEKKILLLGFVPDNDRYYGEAVKYSKSIGFEPLNCFSVNFEQYKDYADELVALIKKAFDAKLLSMTILELVESAKTETEDLKAVMSNRIEKLHEQAQEFAIKRDQEIANLDELNAASMAFTRELQKKKES